MGFIERSGYCPRCRMVYDYAVEPDENAVLSVLYNTAFNHKKSVVLEQQPGFPPRGHPLPTRRGIAGLFLIQSIPLPWTCKRPGRGF